MALERHERNEPALGFADIRPRIIRPASCSQDEGIVRPVSKEMDQLSRRLHHHTPLRATGRRFLSYTMEVATAKTLHALDPRDAAYIAGLIDGEGTITLTREHRGENRRLVVSISSTERVLLDFVAAR